MIYSIDIKNFQSHAESKLEFDPGFNVIVGTSDSGKTAILRALRWVVTNKPAGTAFCSYWAPKQETSVTIEVDEHVITRFRNTTKSGYRDNKTELTAINREVPEQIASVINMNEINLQQQFDAPFLLDNSPGEVAQFFNKIAKLDKIDSSIKYLKGLERQNTQEVKEVNASIERDNKLLAQFIHLDSIDEKLAKIEQKQDNYTKKQTAYLDLQDKCQELQKTQQVLDTYASVYEASTRIEYLITQSQQYQKEKESLLQKHCLVSSYRECLEELAELGGADTIEQANKVCSSLITRNEAYNESSEALQKQQKQVALYQALLEEIERLKQELVVSEKELKDSMPDICPLCGGEIHES